jgi:predicted SAM-dependent methyltransferase
MRTLLARRLHEAHTSVERSLDSARFAVGRIGRAKRIEAYLERHSVRKLQLGSGSNVYDGWLNTDVIDFRRRREVVYLDATRRFPLPDSSFDRVFTEHMIEHLSYEQGVTCLRECQRVLKPGGRVRIATPSLSKLAALYSSDLSDLQWDYLAWSTSSFIHDAPDVLPGFVVNNMFHNFEHRFVYDDETLRVSLEIAGFVDIERWPVGESGDPAFVGLERHMRSAAKFNAYETLVLEAKKQ